MTNERTTKQILKDDYGVTTVAHKILKFAKDDACRALLFALQSGTVQRQRNGEYSERCVRFCFAKLREAQGGGKTEVKAQAKTETPPPAGSGGVVEDVIWNQIKSKVDALATERALEAAEAAEGTVDTAAVVEQVLAMVEELSKAPRTILLPNGKVGDLPAIRHSLFEDIAEQCTVKGRNMMLVGPSGTGKTHMVEQLAGALGRCFYVMSMSAGGGEADIKGRWLPTGEGGKFEFHLADFARAYRDGYLILLDEADAADSNLLVAVNAALTNGYLSIPGYGTVARHADTVIALACNTFGTGPDRSYVGREQMDLSTIRRTMGSTFFVDYDANVERELARQFTGEGQDDRAKEVLTWVWKLRAAVLKAGLHRSISTQLIIDGAKEYSVCKRRWDAFKTRTFAGWTHTERNAVGRLAPAEAPATDWAALAEAA